MPRILIADDHPVFRRGLKQLLGEAFADSTFAEAATSQEAVAKVRQQAWDLLLLDISMPGRNGLEALKEVRGSSPRLPVLVVSMHPEAQYAVRALKAGASGYINKESAPEEIAGAVKTLLAGRKYVSASLAQLLASDLEARAEKPPHETLSDREYAVLCAIAAGKSVTRIAREWCLSVKTVSTYRVRLCQKLRLKTVADLIRYAIEKGLPG